MEELYLPAENAAALQLAGGMLRLVLQGSEQNHILLQAVDVTDAAIASAVVAAGAEKSLSLACYQKECF